jgi:antitoxin CptB
MLGRLAQRCIRVSSRSAAHAVRAAVRHITTSAVPATNATTAPYVSTSLYCRVHSDSVSSVVSTVPSPPSPAAAPSFSGIPRRWLSSSDASNPDEAKLQYTFIPSQSQQPQSPEIRLKKIMYRCKMRGMLELDLLLGSWANEHAQTLTDQDLDDLEALSLAETPEVLKWVMKKEDPPADFDSRVLRQLQAYTFEQDKLWHNTQ